MVFECSKCGASLDPGAPGGQAVRCGYCGTIQAPTIAGPVAHESSPAGIPANVISDEPTPDREIGGYAPPPLPEVEGESYIERYQREEEVGRRAREVALVNRDLAAARAHRGGGAKPFLSADPAARAAVILGLVGAGCALFAVLAVVFLVILIPLIATHGHHGR